MLFSEWLLSNPAAAAAAVVAVLLLYVIGLVIQRLYLSPVAKFPGPKLAAATFWYEFYFDVVKRGQYIWKIREMHEKYGPIVRINPYELHIHDPDYYDVIFSGPSKRRDKWEWSAKMFGNSLGSVGTVPHNLHRMRRAPLNPYFSMQSINRLEPAIKSVIEIFCDRLREARRSGEPLDLFVAYSALTGDVITEYCFGKSYGLLAEPDLGREWPEVFRGVGELTHLIKQFGWLFPLMQALPMWFVAMANPKMMPLLRHQESVTAQIKAIMNGRKVADGKSSDFAGDHPTIFHELLDSSLSPAEKTLERLMNEGLSLVGAGLYTTAFMLKTTSFHVLANPKIRQKLRAELASAMPNPETPVSLQQLEQLPYLSAVVSEGLRISSPVCGRLPRVSPDAPLTFREWEIPAGTPVSMTTLLIHQDPRIFPEPHEFRPERWLQKDRLDRYLVPFSKGTRSCLGMNLANAEIYHTLATVFREFGDMELYETTREDVDIAYDFFSPAAKLDSKGVRVLVK